MNTFRRSSWYAVCQTHLVRTALRLLLMLAVVAAVSPLEAWAAGGFGSVWVDSKTTDTITLNWTDPDTSNYQHCANPEEYKICYEIAGDIERACEGGTVVHTSLKPYPVTGLTSSTYYKFKVFSKTEKKNRRGQWKNCKFRKVATLKQKTETSPTPDGVGNLSVIATGDGTITAEATWSRPADFNLMRICYKKTQSNITLKSNCSKREKPWSESDKRRGWAEITPLLTFQAEFPVFSEPKLTNCRQYKLLAYGFITGSDTGTDVGSQIGKANGRPGVSCATNKMSDLVIDNHEDALQSYASALATYYRPPPPPPPPPSANSLSALLSANVALSPGAIFDHVAATRPELSANLAIFAEDEESLTGNYDTIEYLNEAEPEIFQAWQSEPDLVAAGMSLPQYMQRMFPTIYAALLEEADTVTVSASPTSVAAGQPVTLTAIVTGYSPTGTVQFQVNGVNIGSPVSLVPVSLVNGVAVLTTTAISPGANEITAVYSGDTSNAASSSAVGVVTVASPSAEIPTLPEWAMLLFMLGLITTGLRASRRAG